MLLFLLHDNFRDPTGQPMRMTDARSAVRGDARALLSAGLVLSVWCGLRLLAARGHGSSVDVALAVPCLCLGIATMLRSARDLRGGQPRPHVAEWASR